MIYLPTVFPIPQLQSASHRGQSTVFPHILQSAPTDSAPVPGGRGFVAADRPSPVLFVEGDVPDFFEREAVAQMPVAEFFQRRGHADLARDAILLHEIRDVHVCAPDIIAQFFPANNPTHKRAVMQTDSHAQGNWWSCARR